MRQNPVLRRRAKGTMTHHDHDNRPYKIRLPRWFFASAFLATSFLAFILGRSGRATVVRLILKVEIPSPSDGYKSDSLTRKRMPQLLLPPGKPIPSTGYSSKHFDTAMTTCDSVLLTTSKDQTSAGACGQVDQSSCSNSEYPIELQSTIPPFDRDEGGHHQPVGQHLLVDINNVDGAFLNSQERLAQAMVTLVEKSGSTMLSYHCHKLDPIGVSCVGVLLESHISFHTWPEASGVITLDIFTCGKTRLLPLLSVVESLFGIPQSPLLEPPILQWSLKYRGYPRGGEERNPEEVDLDQFMLGWSEYPIKERISEVQSDFQFIEIYDVINPRFRTVESHKRSLANDGSYESLNSDLFLLDRVVYLDKIMQSRRFGEKEYHEALVHPAMFAHENPKRVAIIGGGEGATLREVLKHRTVEQVTMIEIDEVMVSVSRRYIPEWSTCRDIAGGTDSCFDDPRASVLYSDAVAWFKDKFGGDATVSDDELFDVIIMDALDPSSVIEFSDVLYGNDDFIAALGRSLSPGGILVTQVGQASNMKQPAREFTRERVLDERFISDLRKHGLVKIKEYAEGHGGFMGVWAFLVAFRDAKSSERWYATEAEIDLSVRRRILPTRSGSNPLHFFDGSVMRSYSYPSRIIEEVFCRKDPPPSLCSSGHGLNPEIPEARSSSLSVSPSRVPVAGWGLFFSEAFPKGTYVAIDQSVNDVLVPPKAKRVIKGVTLRSTPLQKWDPLTSYIAGHGLATDMYGDPAFLVDSGVKVFANRGCRRTDNESETSVYDPFVDRNHLVLLAADVTGRDVEAREEMKSSVIVRFGEGIGNRSTEHPRFGACSMEGKDAEAEASPSIPSTICKASS